MNNRESDREMAARMDTGATLGRRPSQQGFKNLISASCSDLKDYDIYNAQNEKLGNFEDIMLDIQSGRVAYAVMSYGGFAGMGKKMLAIPWDALSIMGPETYADKKASKRMILNIPKDKLDHAPTFKKDEWPAQPDREWLNRNLYTPYGYTPWWDHEGM